MSIEKEVATIVCPDCLKRQEVFIEITCNEDKIEIKTVDGQTCTECGTILNYDSKG